jgi:ferrous iron transport protein A
MPVALLRNGEKGIIGRVKGPPALRQYLETLGFVKGEEVAVVQSSGESIVLRIKGSRIALSKEMARRIWIEDQGSQPNCECRRFRK